MPDDPVTVAIVDLLTRAPARWQDLDRDDLTASEDQALGLVVAAGLIEVRVGIEMTMAGHPDGVRLTLELTGETGLATALAPVLTDLLARWEEALAAATTRSGTATPVSLLPHGGTSWRITDQGLLARRDLASDDPAVRAGVISHVLSRIIRVPGGTPIRIAVDAQARVPEWRDLPLPPIDGHARVITRTWVNAGAVPAAPDGPVPVTVQNWTSGAEALAAACATLIPSAQPPRADASDEGYGANPARWNGKAKLALLRFLRKHPSARPAKRLIADAVAAGIGPAATVDKYLRQLRKAGWVVDGDVGTCLTDLGHRGVEKLLGKTG